MQATADSIFDVSQELLANVATLQIASHRDERVLGQSTQENVCRLAQNEIVRNRRRNNFLTALTGES